MKIRIFSRLTIALPILFGFASAPPAWCDSVVFSNFSSTPPGYVSDGFQLGVSSLGPPFFFAFADQWAMGFTVPKGSSYELTSIEVPLNFPSGPTETSFSIESDSNGKPGAVLESFTFSGSSSTPAIFTGISTLNPVLVGGAKYWLEAQMPVSEVGKNVDWNAAAGVTSGKALGLVAFQNLPFSPPWSPTLQTQAAFSVRGTAIPEPASLILLGTVFLLLAMVVCLRTPRTGKVGH